MCGIKDPGERRKRPTATPSSPEVQFSEPPHPVSDRRLNAQRRTMLSWTRWALGAGVRMYFVTSHKVGDLFRTLRHEQPKCAFANFMKKAIHTHQNPGENLCICSLHRKGEPNVESKVLL